MSRRKTIVLSGYFVSVVSTGCASLNCDPSVESSIITKAGCEFGSGYEEREEALKLTLAEEQKFKKSLLEVHAAISQEQKQIGRKREQSQRKFDKLNRSLGKLLAQLKSRSANNVEMQKQIKQTENALSKVNTETSNSVLKKQAQLDDLQREVSDLEAALAY